MARRPPRRLPLSITILLARAGAEIGPHLLDGTNTPTLHRDIAQSTVSIEDLLTPFAGKKTGLAFRVHADNDAKTAGGVADAIVASLRETGLPADPAEAVAVLAKSPVPFSITLQYEYLDEAEWPVGVKNLAEAFGETNGRAEVEGGLLLHAYLSTAGAAALPSHEDLGDILVVQLAGAKTWTFDDYVVTLEPGDGLVIPADTRHAARATEGGVSAHLTIHRIAEHQTDIARRQLSHDEDDRHDDDPHRCYSGDAECPSACEYNCDDCVYCTDADTICRSEVEKNPFYDGYPYYICCLTGYASERAGPCTCPDWPGPDPECNVTSGPTTLTPAPTTPRPSPSPTTTPAPTATPCVNDDSTTDRYGATCSPLYEYAPSACGYRDDEDFTASLQCCACGGFLGKTLAPTVSAAPTPAPTPRPSYSPTATPENPTAVPTSPRPTRPSPEPLPPGDDTTDGSSAGGSSGGPNAAAIGGGAAAGALVLLLAAAGASFYYRRSTAAKKSNASGVFDEASGVKAPPPPQSAVITSKVDEPPPPPPLDA
jgi:mannose-6-phosphate isomerase-like protein (cupin superfamily)